MNHSFCCPLNELKYDVMLKPVHVVVDEHGCFTVDIWLLTKQHEFIESPYLHNLGSFRLEFVENLELDQFPSVHFILPPSQPFPLRRCHVVTPVI